MPSRLPLASVTLLVGFLQLASGIGVAQTLSQICHPALTPPVVVASPAQRLAAGARAEPPLTDTFDWPDTPLGVIKTARGYEFFGSDGGYHARQMWQGQWASFFCLENKHWRIIGLDTGYNSTRFDWGKVPVLQRSKWLRKTDW